MNDYIIGLHSNKFIDYDEFITVKFLRPNESIRTIGLVSCSIIGERKM